MIPNDQFSAFIQNAEQVFGWNKEKIRTLLKERFGTYAYQKEAEYTAYLEEISEKEDAERAARLIREQQYGLATCPICGQRTVSALDWYTPSTTKPWKCLGGGIKHFFMWRINNIQRHRGKGIIFEENPNASSTNTQ